MDAQRQRLNVRVIRTTLDAAVRGADPQKARASIARAKALILVARSTTTDPAAAEELDRFESELDNVSVETETEHSG
jgi:hypothetical protein